MRLYLQDPEEADILDEDMIPEEDEEDVDEEDEEDEPIDE